jgi:hypothetical protein
VLKFITLITLFHYPSHNSQSGSRSSITVPSFPSSSFFLHPWHRPCVCLHLWLRRHKSSLGLREHRDATAVRRGCGLPNNVHTYKPSIVFFFFASSSTMDIADDLCEVQSLLPCYNIHYLSLDFVQYPLPAKGHDSNWRRFPQYQALPSAAKSARPSDLVLPTN